MSPLLTYVTIGLVCGTACFILGMVAEAKRWCAAAASNYREPYYCRGDFYYVIPEAEYVVMKVACMEHQLQKQTCNERKV